MELQNRLVLVPVAKLESMWIPFENTHVEQLRIIANLEGKLRQAAVIFNRNCPAASMTIRYYY